MSLLLSSMLFIGVLLYIFLPGRKVRALAAKSRSEHLIERREVLYDNLRDLNFEFKAGKYIESDYTAQRETLEQEAAIVVAEIRAAESARSSS